MFVASYIVIYFIYYELFIPQEILTKLNITESDVENDWVGNRIVSDEGFKIKILLIDDDAEFTGMIVGSVSNLGFEILTAHSGEEAMEVIKKEHKRIAMIVSDLKMPGMSGIDLRREMLRDYKEIPFIILSGYVTREIALQGVECKISAFLEKPVDQKIFLQTLQSESKDRIAAIKEDDELLSGFIIEAEALIEEMESIVLLLENSPEDMDLINRIFRCAHTIKGASGYFKPDLTHRFTHKFEDYLSKFKENPKTLDSHAISIFLKALDTLKILLTEMKDNKLNSLGIDELVKIFTVNPQQPIDRTDSKIAPKQDFKAHVSEKTEELRVSISLLDEFMEKSGELTVLRNMINKTVRLIEIENPTNSNVSILSDLLGEMHKSNAFMQERIVDLRKVPLKHVFKPLHRTMRDLCMNLRKQISLEIQGDDLRVDHTISDILSKCLTHIVRNAADHGIEDQDTRKKLEKPPNGKISISADGSSEYIVIKIKDDGKGIDANFIKKKAIEKQIVSAATAEGMSLAELRLLIFEPGFSTAEKVTDISGRGVGTDMVKKTILSVGGQIEVNSEVGKGTEFVLKLPVPKSVMIISSLLVKGAGMHFAIPQDNIVRVIKLESLDLQSSVRYIKDSAYFLDNKKLVPIVSIAEIFDLAPAKGWSGAQPTLLIYIHTKNGNFCLKVDEILDVEDTVLKRIGRWLQKIKFYSGATFLGDGRVGLILDLEGIAEKLNLEASSKEVEQKQDILQSVIHSYLLFDLGLRASFGVRQQELFRLEEVRATEIQYVGKQPVIIYRNKTMRLFLMRDLLSSSKGDLESLKSKGALQVIVMELNSQYYGFIVDHIGDFVDLQGAPPAEDRNIQRHELIIQNKTVNIVNLKDLIPAAS